MASITCVGFCVVAPLSKYEIFLFVKIGKSFFIVCESFIIVTHYPSHFTKEPVAPAGTGSIDVTFDPEGRPGTFRKEVKVYTNAGKASIKLIIEGIVVPKK